MDGNEFWDIPLRNRQNFLPHSTDSIKFTLWSNPGYHFNSLLRWLVSWTVRTCWIQQRSSIFPPVLAPYVLMKLSFVASQARFITFWPLSFIYQKTQSCLKFQSLPTHPPFAPCSSGNCRKERDEVCTVTLPSSLGLDTGGRKVHKGRK